MGVYASIRSGNTVPAAVLAQLACGIGTCELGTPGTVYSFDPGSDVSVLGHGVLPAFVLYMQAEGASCSVCPATPTWQPLPAVTHLDASGGSNPVGPTVTIALTNGTTGPFDSAALDITITVGGQLGAAQASVSYDSFVNGTIVETFALPQPGPAILQGTVDLSLGACLHGLTLVFSAPSAGTVTFPAGSLPASAAGLLAATATATTSVTVLAANMLPAGIAALASVPRQLTFLTGGTTPTHVPATVTITGTYAGGTVTEVLNLATTATSVTSVYRYTNPSITYSAGGGTDATVTVGYTDAYANSAEVATQFTAQAAAQNVAIAGRVYQTATGTQLLQIYSTLTGLGVTATIASGTAETALGFSGANLTGTGTAATRSFPALGVTATFGPGAYVLNEQYQAPLAGPQASVAALTAAAQAAHDQFLVAPFGFLVTTDPFVSNSAAASALTALTGMANTWIADPNDPVDVSVLVGTAFHAASPVLATNDAGIAANDASILAAVGGTTANLNSLAVDDIYLDGDQKLMLGTFRRPATWAGAAKVASATKIAANPAEGPVAGSLLAQDNLTRARDEARATTKLGKLNGPGFWALMSASGSLGNPKFELCATRAGASSRLRSPGAVAVALTALTTMMPEVQHYQGQTWQADPTNANAAALGETSTREGHLYQVLKAVLQPPAPKPPNVSKFDVSVTAPNLANDTNAYASMSFNPLLEVGNVYVTVTATTATISTAASNA